MEKVAHSLQKSALTFNSGSDDFDRFGRSSFNRYYYATFLLVREMIREFEPQYQAIHSQMPDYLCGSVAREFSNFRTKAQRRGEKESVLLCGQAIAALRAVAGTLREAYAVRVVADYNPEIKIQVSSADRFVLTTTSINQAHDWPTRTRAQLSSIRRGWRLVRGI